MHVFQEPDLGHLNTQHCQTIDQTGLAETPAEACYNSAGERMKWSGTPRMPQHQGTQV